MKDVDIPPLRPKSKQCLNAKMSTFIAVSFTINMLAYFFSPPFPPPLSVVDRKMERQDNCNFSQPAVCTQLFWKKKKAQTKQPKKQKAAVSGAHTVHRDPYLLSVIYNPYIPFRLYVYYNFHSLLGFVNLREPVIVIDYRQN